MFSSSRSALLRAAWAYFSAPGREPYIRFFHEVFALALQDPAYRVFVEQVADGRAAMITAALSAMGVPAARTHALATLVTAAVRGLQLHLLSTGDRAAIYAAFEEFLTALDALVARPPDGA